MIEFRTGVYSTQAKGVAFTLQVGSWVWYFGKRDAGGFRLELFTHYHLFRWSDLRVR